jgi:pyrroloquinoline quinone (PQQ) biosynthesis protein C
MSTIDSLPGFIDRVATAESDLLRDLCVADRLHVALQDKGGLQRFAESFYFVRGQFVRFNFLVGARCPMDEVYWAGLTQSLMEELGGPGCVSHNELYRRFMVDAGAATAALSPPQFTVEFDRSWEQFCQTAPLEEAVGALAVYEILDNPDYGMLLEVLSTLGVSERGLRFFRVHAEARHVTFFADFWTHVAAVGGGTESQERAAEFVVDSQRKMWAGLLAHLEHA